jgi:hypothetical protein
MVNGTSKERYSEVLKENIDKMWYLPVDPIRLGILHGALRLMLIHPEVKEKYTQAFKDIAGDMREWCLERYLEMGFTQEEVASLDSEFA